MLNFDKLIERGDELRHTQLGTPRFEMWSNDVRAAVKPYGESNMAILESALSTGVITMDGPNYNDDKIDDVLELLEELKKRTPESERAQDGLINQKQAEAKATLQSKFNKITVNGNGDVTFGDGSPITKVTVSEFMASLIKEVKQMPESEDQHKILESLKSVVANPTFAAVSGAVVSSILKRLMETP